MKRDYWHAHEFPQNHWLILNTVCRPLSIWEDSYTPVRIRLSMNWSWTLVEQIWEPCLDPSNLSDCQWLRVMPWSCFHYNWLLPDNTSCKQSLTNLLQLSICNLASESDSTWITRKDVLGCSLYFVRKHSRYTGDHRKRTKEMLQPTSLISPPICLCDVLSSILSRSGRR